MEAAASILPQVILDGLSLGFLYAVVALGYTMVYGILEFINFAHSEIFMFGAFIGMEVLAAFAAIGMLGGGYDAIALVAALVVGMGAAGLLGVTVEYAAYRPLRQAPKLVPLITAIGVSFLLIDVVRIIWTAARGNIRFGLPVLFPGGLEAGGFQVPYRALLVAGIALAIMSGLILLINRTKIGRAMRAVAQDRNTAALMGINVDKAIRITFLLGGALGGAAGVLFGVYYTTIEPYIGFVIGLKSFTAAVFGGIGNLAGAMLGGILLGLFEALGSAYLTQVSGGAFGPEYKDLFAFVLLIMVLIFRPGGLLGQNLTEKV